MNSKNFDLMLNFGCIDFDTTAGIDKLNDFKLFLDIIGINYKIHKGNDILQFILNDLNLYQYSNLKSYYYKNMYNNNALYDINDVMFMSYDNMVDRLCRA